MRILLRAGKRPDEIVRPEAAFQRNRNGVFSSNSGNLFFWNSVYRTLNTPNNEIVPNALATERPSIVNDGYVARINDEFDHFVIPLANAFRKDFIPALDTMSDVIEQLTIPVSVVGVGAQLSFTRGDQVTKMNERLVAPVTRFVRAVLERSTKIGVRGEFTREYLASLGFGDDHVEVIGCPSMLDTPKLRVTKTLQRLDRDARLSFNSPQHLPQMAEALQWHLERYPNFHFVQQDHRELAVMMWGEPNWATVIAPFPKEISSPLYAQDRVRFFLDPAPWEQYLAEKDFSFGARIHGNIAALRAGTPAMVLTSDSRTEELAQYHQIPFQRIRDDSFVRAEELYERADFTKFHAVQQENFDRYTRFLESNGLEHIHTPGNENPEYDQLLAGTDYGDAVRGFMSGHHEEIASRLNWLWQGVSVDQLRLHDIYRPEFVPAGDLSNWETTNKLLRRYMNESSAKVRSLESEIKQLRQSQSTKFQQFEQEAGKQRERIQGLERWSLLKRVAARVKRLLQPREHS